MEKFRSSKWSFMALMTGLALIVGIPSIVGNQKVLSSTPTPTAIVESVQTEVKGDQTSLPEPTATETPTGTPTSTPTSTPIPTVKPTIAPTMKPWTPAPTVKPVTTNTTTSGWACNCSKTCDQMSSCSEAQYQLNVCGCGRRDADNDGIACDADCQ